MRKTPIRLLAVGLAASLVALSACGDDGNDDTATEAPADTATAPADEPGNIVEVAIGAGSFSTLVAAVQAAGLAETLSGDGPFTVFAPTDDAFAALPEGIVDALLRPENQDTLAKILTYHVVAGEVRSTDIAPGDVETVEGQTIALATDDGVTVNGANVIAADVDASNGVIHVIDAVLLPPDVDPAALLAGADDMDEATEGMEGDMDEAADANTIVDVAVEAGTFETLVAAVTAADLAEVLSGDGPFTVFAPTDEAFAALPEGLVEALLLPENKDILVQILTYHVVSGEVLAADIEDGDVETVEGQTIELSTEDGVTVNGVNVVAADVMASNGVIHVIDGVLLPPGIDPAALLG
jgi:transforming growth factor-beta-induced protein